MGAYGQFACEWCKQMVDDRERYNHECDPMDLKIHIADLRARLDAGKEDES